MSQQRLNEISDEISLYNDEIRKRTEEQNAFHEKIQALKSERFKIKSGKAYGDTFMYRGKSYLIVSSREIRLAGNSSKKMTAKGLRQFLIGDSDSPFVENFEKLREELGIANIKLVL